MTKEQAATIFAPVMPSPGFDVAGAWLTFGAIVLVAAVLPLVICYIVDTRNYR